MRRRFHSILKTTGIIILTLALGGYVWIQTKDVTAGPLVEISSPQEGLIEKDFIYIEGQAENISWMSINNRAIFVNESGEFKEPQVLLPGYNPILIEAEDRYGKRDELQINLYHPKIKKVISS